ncbi:MAG: peptide deformylase [Dehalococcoidia bacterium]|nr:peptide deformylase [Dehalococcoidia bacterium]
MAVLPLRTLPDPRLRLKAKRVRTVDASILKLIDDMIDTMHHVNGVGLAAPQVGENLTLFVIQTPALELVAVNPEITKQAGQDWYTETCLSIPGRRMTIKRPKLIKFRYQDLNGIWHSAKFHDFYAAIVAHELDHLKGVLITDYLGTSEAR